MAGKNEYTVFDYLQWRGDLTLQQDPFNEVDNLVLCIIAYINLRKIDRLWRTASGKSESRKMTAISR